MFFSLSRYVNEFIPIDLFTNTAAILNSIVSYIYYGMLRGQISSFLPPEHPIIAI